MIKKLDKVDIPLAVRVIRESFATVAKEFGLTEQNCPKHPSFITTNERLQKYYSWDWLMYGLYDEEQLVGYVSISKKDDYVFEIRNLAVLPEYRHKGYGRQLLDFCKEKVKEMKGNKIELSMNIENIVLKNWYAANGFVLTETKRFELFPFSVGYMSWEIC